ncbi:C2 domain-containing protein [Cyclospora cayetanensis]|uniref:C2 domain-containing protein n=1 Tax=Cyclospora cayetanensis TaxID=88456 RepID=A0A1D3CWB1_9EIME|nr:C2 domain-containing protein [Cyclospora cayetanensis]
MALHRLRIEVVAAVDLPAVDGSTSDPFVIVKYKGAEFKTEVIKKTLSPKWNFLVNMNYNKSAGPHKVRFEVWDYNKILRNVLLGVVDLNLQELPLQQPPPVGQPSALPPQPLEQEVEETAITSSSPRARKTSSSSGRSSDSDGEGAQQKKKSKREKQKRGGKTTVEAEPVLVLEIKQVLPQLQYGEISKALARHNNNKEEALKDLVILVASRNAPNKDGVSAA